MHLIDHVIIGTERLFAASNARLGIIQYYQLNDGNIPFV